MTPTRANRTASGVSRRSGERLHGAIARDLGIAIVSGKHKPGEALTNEIQFSEMLDVSRSAYREAIRTLAAKGLVESRPRTGTRVLPTDRWNLMDPDVLAWFFEGEPSEVVVEGIFELRAIIEPAAAALAAERRTEAQLMRMESRLREMQRRTLRTVEGQSADRDFHQTLLEATANPALISLASTIGAGVRWTTFYKSRKQRLPADPMPQHWEVYHAVEAGDPERARRAMAVLVADARAQTAEIVRARPNRPS
ncbi:GntR family transcriptional regulator [Brevundimonas sp. Leaf363]|uniref:FadR/GntR family transcriptional regulator n=1 Tax=Brevundimonas sp. Leaf363 TaxID=1736353 RepID=UPI0006F22ED4|nr:FadR/GntR family transcriptional regulator [Brevundimonas sp. Leaf363]KQS54264.1 GntR family transcriptional regulator [Brevundimonas sp. Leaf363]